MYGSSGSMMRWKRVVTMKKTRGISAEDVCLLPPAISLSIRFFLLRALSL